MTGCAPIAVGAWHDAARHYTHDGMGIPMYVSHVEHVEPMHVQAVAGRDDLRIAFYQDSDAENPRDDRDYAGGFAVLRAGYRSGTESDGALAQAVEDAFGRFHFAAHNRRRLDESEMLARWARIFHDTTLITETVQGYSQSDWAEIALWVSDADAEREGIADAGAYLRAGAAEWGAWMRGDVAWARIEYVETEDCADDSQTCHGIYPDERDRYSADWFEAEGIPVFGD